MSSLPGVSFTLLLASKELEKFGVRKNIGAGSDSGELIC